MHMYVTRAAGGGCWLDGTTIATLATRHMPPNVFATLSSCATATDVQDALNAVPIDAKVASHALHCLGKLPGNTHNNPPPCVVKLLGALVAAKPMLSAREISKAAWGLGKLVHEGTPSDTRQNALLALDALSSRAADAADTLDAQAVATVLHAHGTLGSAPSTARVMRLLQRRIAKLASTSECAPQDVANVLWSLARLSSAAEPALASALGTLLPSLLHQFKPMELSSTAWALAKAPLFPPNHLALLVCSLHSALGGGDNGTRPSAGSALLRGLSAQGASNTLWAFARIEPAPPAHLVTSLVEQAARQRCDLTPQGLANVCSACAKLSGPALPCLQLLTHRDTVEALGASDVAEVAWALGKLIGLSARGQGGRDHGHGVTDLDAQLSDVAAALWSRAAAVVSQLGWQECGQLDFAMRELPSASDVEAVERAALAPLLSAIAHTAVATVRRERATLEESAVAAVLALPAATWETLPRHAHVLLVGCGSAGGVHKQLSHLLQGAGHNVSQWLRFADAKLDAPACAWPTRANCDSGRYDAVVLRLPPSRASLAHALSAAAAVLTRGGTLVVFGCRAEGMQSTRSHLPTHLWEGATVREPEIERSAIAPRAPCSPPELATRPANVPRTGSLVEQDVFVSGGAAPTAAGVLHARRTATPPDDVGGDSFEQCVSLESGLPVVGGGTAGVSTSTSVSALAPASAPACAPASAAAMTWTTMPGLFAGGAVDIMTTALLEALPTPRERARVLDFCCGSGVIAAAVLAAAPTVRMHIVDADALATRVAATNVPRAKAITLSDCWAGLPPRPRRYDLIVSNPPVHLGLQVCHLPRCPQISPTSIPPPLCPSVPFYALLCPSVPFYALLCPSMPFYALRCPSMTLL